MALLHFTSSALARSLSNVNVAVQHGAFGVSVRQGKPGQSAKAKLLCLIAVPRRKLAPNAWRSRRRDRLVPSRQAQMLRDATRLFILRNWLFGAVADAPAATYALKSFSCSIGEHRSLWDFALLRPCAVICSDDPNLSCA